MSPVTHIRPICRANRAGTHASDRWPGYRPVRRAATLLSGHARPSGTPSASREGTRGTVRICSPTRHSMTCFASSGVASNPSRPGRSRSRRRWSWAATSRGTASAQSRRRTHASWAKNPGTHFSQSLPRLPGDSRTGIDQMHDKFQVRCCTGGPAASSPAADAACTAQSRSAAGRQAAPTACAADDRPEPRDRPAAWPANKSDPVRSPPGRSPDRRRRLLPGRPVEQPQHGEHREPAADRLEVLPPWSGNIERAEVAEQAPALAF